ncbi:MAG: hypothetical protein ACE5EN_07895 [Nitrospinota bacterium]
MYCCEGCLLKKKEFRATQEERDNAYLALAETLTAAIDLRELETGLHSKRVACHTLVLAKHYTDDNERKGMEIDHVMMPVDFPESTGFAYP